MIQSDTGNNVCKERTRGVGCVAVQPPLVPPGRFGRLRSIVWSKGPVFLALFFSAVGSEIDRLLWWRNDTLRDKREGLVWMPWPDRCRWRPGGISSIRSDAGCCARIPAEDRSHQAGEPPTPHLRFPFTALLDFSNFRLIFVWTEWCKGPNRGTLGFKNFWEEKWKYVIATHSQVCFACILLSISISLWCSLTIPLWTQATSTTTFLLRRKPGLTRKKQNTTDEFPVDQVWHKRV